MKITKNQIRRLIREEIATINKDTIEDTVMSVLSDEGGAAGLDPIEDALEELENEDMSLPDEPIEDVIGDVTGVKRHADGDYIDTTQLEGRRIALTTSRIARIIKEERAKLRKAQLKRLVREEISKKSVLSEGAKIDMIVKALGKFKDQALPAITSFFKKNPDLIEDAIRALTSMAKK